MTEAAKIGMTPPPDHPTRFWNWQLSKTEIILLCILVFLLASHLSMVLQRAINWDEYWHYSLVETFVRGDYIQPLQTFYVRVFAWLPHLAGDEIDHIIVARTVMLGCLIVTTVSIIGMVSRLSSRTVGLVCAACFLSVGFVLQHGTSFRADPMVTALLSVGLWILLSSSLSWRSVFLAGILVGLAGLITVKAVLWLPAFVGVCIIRWQERGWSPFLAARFFVAALVAALTFAMIYWLHSNALAPNPEFSTGASISGASKKMFVLFVTDKLRFMLKAALTGLPFAALIVALPIILITSEKPMGQKLGLVGLWLLSLIPLIYYNAYPYLYAFTLVPVAVSIYPAIEVASKRYGLVAIAILLGLNGAANWLTDERGVLEAQRQVLSAVKQIAPDPVAYFDCCGTIGSWPKANGFRTVWGVNSYLAKGRPEFREKMLSEPVPLLIAGGWFRELVPGGGPATEFVPQDANALRDTYIPFWGPVYLAGAELSAFERRDWSVLVPGTYTVEGSLMIDGILAEDSETVEIGRGVTELREAAGKPARLVWGENVQTPDIAAPKQIWTGW